MFNLSLIGESHLEEDVLLNEDFQKGDRIDSNIRINFGGTIRNVAHNTALMGLNPSFCTKLGNDTNAIHIWGELNDLGVTVLGPTVDRFTPKKIVIMPADDKPTVFWDRKEDFFFHPDDRLPLLVFDSSYLTVTDIKNNDVLYKLVTGAAHTKWIISHCIPSREVLKHVWGLVINYADALTLGKPSDFERVCYRLCALGPEWVAINMNFQGVYLFTNNTGQHFATKCRGSGYANGTYSAFLAGLAAGITYQTSLETAVNAGLTAQALTYKYPDLVNPQVRELFRRSKNQ